MTATCLRKVHRHTFVFYFGITTELNNMPCDKSRVYIVYCRICDMIRERTENKTRNFNSIYL